MTQAELRSAIPRKINCDHALQTERPLQATATVICNVSSHILAHAGWFPGKGTSQHEPSAASLARWHDVDTLNFGRAAGEQD